MRRIAATRISLRGSLRSSGLCVSGVVGSDTSASRKREYSCRSMRRLFLAAVVLLGGCPSTPPPACTTTAIDTTCSPQYLPTFDNVFENTLKMDCGSGRNSCHSANGDGDMSLADPDSAYNSLLAGHVVPGDPTCSELIVRTHDLGTDYQMPPGGAISAAERCALVQWVAAGAVR
jgi:hypothetical protein